MALDPVSNFPCPTNVQMRVPLFVLLVALAWSGALANDNPAPLHVCECGTTPGTTTPDPCPCNSTPTTQETPTTPEDTPTTPVTTPSTPVTTWETPTTTEGGNGVTDDIDLAGRCEGATDEQHNPGTMSCFRPECTLEQWLNGTLYPTRDPNFFFQCGPGTGNLYTMPCAPGTCFSFRHQVCVHVRDWQNDCA